MDHTFRQTFIRWIFRVFRHQYCNAAHRQYWEYAREFIGTIDDVNTGIGALKKANRIIIFASGLVLQDTAVSTANAISNDVIPLFRQAFANLSQDPRVKLSEMYRRYMEDEGLMSRYNEIDKAAIIRTSLSILGAFIIGGPAGAVSAAVSSVTGEALSFTINTYTNFFNYVAWVALRYGFSGRYANREWYYMTGEAY